MDKLRTYKLFKKTFELAEYLEIGLDRKYRQCLSSFRISAHNLQIERGRYLGKNVEERKCTDCNVIEYEIHFFYDCNKYNNSREKLYLELGNQHLFLGNDSKDKLINILTSKNMVLSNLFVDICMNATVVKFSIDFISRPTCNIIMFCVCMCVCVCFQILLHVHIAINPIRVDLCSK